MSGLASPLMATVDRALHRDGPTRISIQGHGSISIYPNERAYTADIHDWDSLPMADASGIQLTASVWATPPVDSMPVGTLQWLAAYHHACQLLQAGQASHGLVKLLRWPDLADVPQELAPAVARICALLWRKPFASILMPHVLVADSTQTAALLLVLQDMDCVDINSGFADRMSPDAANMAEAAGGGRHPDSAGTPPTARVIARLWQRLRGH